MAEVKHQCSTCETVYPFDELVVLYECGGCGTIFDRDNSADGVSNRCPDCNKFAAKLTDLGCPDCQEETQEVNAEYSEDGEWVVVEPPEKIIPPVHWHPEFEYPDGKVVLNDEAIHLTLEAAIEWWSHPSVGATRNDDGSFTIHEPGIKSINRIVRLVECIQKHPGRKAIHG